MKRLCRGILIAFIFFTVSIHTSYAAGLYGKPEFKGRVIDAETGQPIEGAVVVILYDKWDLISGPGGKNSHVYKAKETLTDGKGDFSFPQVTSFSLAGMDAGIRFIFYKPGYMASYGPENIKPILVEAYFSAGKVGEESEIEEGRFENSSYVKWKGPLGIVVLRKAKTREEKLRTMPSPPRDFTSIQLPIFIKIINDEGHNLGLKGEYK